MRILDRLKRWGFWLVEPFDPRGGVPGTAALMTFAGTASLGTALGLYAFLGAVGHAPPAASRIKPASPTDTSSAGCYKTVQPKGRYQLTSGDGQMRRRTYQIVVPQDYNGRTPLALVFGFHGANGAGRDALAEGVLNARAVKSNAIVVAPDGIAYQGGGTGWDDSCSGYDIALFDRILAEIEDKYCIDPSRIFAYGHSWGGDFSTALACCRGDLVRAVAPNAATDEFTDVTDFRTYANGSCPSPVKPAVRFTHSDGGDEAYPAPMFETTSKLFRSFNACTDQSLPISPRPCVKFQGCKEAVIECSYPGLGHRVPPSYGQETWDFFDGLPAR